ncbi:MAG: MBL fold metallo-hydrolase [Solirubrobacteraceae bacterium]
MHFHSRAGRPAWHVHVLLSRALNTGLREVEVNEILLTHGHADHAGSAAELAQRTGATLLGPALAADIIAGRRTMEPPRLLDWKKPLFEPNMKRVPEARPVGLDHAPAIVAITAPTCLIWGDADPISPLSVGQQLHQLLPASTLHILPGATHSLAHDRADEVTTLIVDHLR